MLTLKTRAQFDAVLAGQVLAKTPHFVLHGRDFGADELMRLGLPPGHTLLSPMVPKRWARRAVTRNLIKRQIKALACDHAQLLPMHCYVVRLRSGFDKNTFVSASSDALRVVVRQELQKLFTLIRHSAAPAKGNAALEQHVPKTPLNAS